MSVTFIPSQQDDQASSSPIPFRSSPFLLAWYDLRLLWSLKFHLPQLFRPWSLGDHRSELHLFDLRNIREIALHVVLSVLPLAYFTALACSWWLIPGALCVLLTVPVILLVQTVATFLNGKSSVIRSTVTLKFTERFPHEKWVYVNGICTGYEISTLKVMKSLHILLKCISRLHWCQLHVDLLSDTFRRPIIGIHNPR